MGGSHSRWHCTHGSEWDDAGGRLWIFAGNTDTGPLLSVVQHAYSTYWKSVREIRFGKLVSRNEAL